MWHSLLQDRSQHAWAEDRCRSRQSLGQAGTGEEGTVETPLTTTVPQWTLKVGVLVMRIVNVHVLTNMFVYTLLRVSYFLCTYTVYLLLCSRRYREYAFVRTDEEREQFLYHLLTLTARDFSCFTTGFHSASMLSYVQKLSLKLAISLLKPQVCV